MYSYVLPNRFDFILLNAKVNLLIFGLSNLSSVILLFLTLNVTDVNFMV